jgi:hypothetical protein
MTTGGCHSVRSLGRVRPANSTREDPPFCWPVASSGRVQVPFPELVDLGVLRLVAELRAKHMPTG